MGVNKMSVQAYINFNGNCREAVEFYTDVFGVEEPLIMSYKDMPEDGDFPLTEETKDLVLHSTLFIEGSNVMFSDIPPGMSFVTGSNINLMITNNDMDNIKSTFNKLKVDGIVGMELQETFWSKLYGYVTDKFGVGWQFDYDDESV